jgi:hypothetical protein
MAKARNLAALAGLAGLAYAMRGNKDKEDAGKSADSSSYASPDARTKSMDMPTNESSYARNNMTPMQGVGIADNNPLVKTRTPAQSIATGTQSPSMGDMSEGITNTPASPSARSDQLSAVSRASKREAKTKQFAQDTPEELSAQKTDALAVSSRAARAADARRRAAKQSSFKSGGMVSKVSSASSRADGIATKGKTRGKIC